MNILTTTNIRKANVLVQVGTQVTSSATSSNDPVPSGVILLDTRSGSAADLQAMSNLTTWVTAVKAQSSNGPATNLFVGSDRYTDPQDPQYTALSMSAFNLTTDFDGLGTHALRIELVGIW